MPTAQQGGRWSSQQSAPHRTSGRHQPRQPRGKPPTVHLPRRVLHLRPTPMGERRRMDTRLVPQGRQKPPTGQTHNQKVITRQGSALIDILKPPQKESPISVNMRLLNIRHTSQIKTCVLKDIEISSKPKASAKKMINCLVIHSEIAIFAL